MSRPLVLLALPLAAIAAVAALASPSEPHAAPGRTDPRPNFVVVFADDLGWGDLELHGQERISTPNLTRMAVEGATFCQLYSAANVCPPARDGLLTGRHTGHTGIRLQGVLPADSPSAPRYLPRHLAGAGYATGVFGKWGMGSYTLEPDGSARVTGGAPERLGFHEMLGTMTHRDAHTYTLPPYPLGPNDERIHPRLWTIAGGRTREAQLGPVPYTQELYVRRALDFVRRHRDRPFFLYLPWTIPHAELYLPPDDPAWDGYLDASGRSVFPETPWPGDRLYRRPNPHPRATYAAMVTRLDRDLGLLLDLLDELGLSEHTLVVFTSDNGPHSAGGIGSPAFFDSAGGLSGAKRSLGEGGIRVPGLVRWPGTVAAGRTIDEPVAAWDLLPTFLELAGVAAPPAGVDGISLAPLLAGEEQRPHDEQAPLYWESWEGTRGQAVRLGRYKLLRTRIAGANDPVRLYDVEADPAEQEDLAGDPALCPVYLRLVRLMNESRVDPGGFRMPPLALDCPAATVPPRVWAGVGAPSAPARNPAAPADAVAGSAPGTAAGARADASRWPHRGLGCPPRRGIASGP